MGIKVTDKRNKGQSISKSRADFRNTKAKKKTKKKPAPPILRLLTKEEVKKMKKTPMKKTPMKMTKKRK